MFFLAIGLKNFFSKDRSIQLKVIKKNDFFKIETSNFNGLNLEF